MAKQSLFSACKRVFRDGISGTYTVGNNNIFLELYSQQDIDNNNEIGNSSEENIVIVAGDTITIPSGYTLTPVKPKKSLVIYCNTFVNNGTVSMYQKAPNVLPHDLFIIEKNELGGNKDVIIPAYANNQVIGYQTTQKVRDSGGLDGNNGENRNCGSGGTGTIRWWKGTNGTVYHANSGSGYAFGGGAGGAGCFIYESLNTQKATLDVDSVYPMRGANAVANPERSDYNIVPATGGNGNPAGISVNKNGTVNVDPSTKTGCGGRIIIFCCNFTNNGTITVNGCNTIMPVSGSHSYYSVGGASGAGAVDLFYTALSERGTITANGGSAGASGSSSIISGKGGNGSITLTAWSKNSVLKPIQKYMSKENMVYFLTNYIQRLKQGED